jgi:nicotinamide-nucleotide amidase
MTETTVGDGFNVGTSCADEIGRRLGARRLACAESVTAGLIAQELASVRGSMEWFRGGVVAYQRRTKLEVLGVQPGPLVTPVVAEQMALGVARLLSADVAVSATGAAGPEPLDGAAPGTVVVGVYLNGSARSFGHFFRGAPDEICCSARDAALGDLLEALRSAEAGVRE